MFQELHAGQETVAAVPDEPETVSYKPALTREIEQLPSRQKEVIYLKFFEGFDYLEITGIMSISYQVARNYASRGIKRLREQIGNQQTGKFLPHTQPAVWKDIKGFDGIRHDA